MPLHRVGADPGWGSVRVPNKDSSERKFIEALMRNRSAFVEQIKRSEETIARSRELLKRIDALLKKTGEKP